MKSIYEEAGGTYTWQGDYELPNLIIPPEKEIEIGVWGQRHRRYLKQYHKIRYYNLLTAGTLNGHLAEIEQQAERMFQSLVSALSNQENVTEKLKANHPMEWVQKMNSIRNRATEIVNSELIYI
ncbi:TnpV protein [Bittarella massiliensis (ex Durand et al. 2017)]|uniref:TnpV protein n=1 Tax=Bittarella massiliensis (ex Durand et al. 2017) TaxID=1720313 RepID=A0ABW9WX43_9FIRM|nr:TnpV protein [Bittarella massiliensis (ex Durand et al. 2017)]MZL70362.1 TnpV protein [Bittarella massiliensis (ex Durand et al. 2017)]MZL81657.1 TnpV protein [Bittarella massiliensis (ex Durand et al. 2017)]